MSLTQRLFWKCSLAQCLSLHLPSWLLSEGWDFPRAWEGREVTLSHHEAKLLSPNLPSHQMTRAAASSDPSALERTRACVLRNTGQPPGMAGEVIEADTGGDYCPCGHRTQRSLTPAPGGARSPSIGRLFPGSVVMLFLVSPTSFGSLKTQRAQHQPPSLEWGQLWQLLAETRLCTHVCALCLWLPGPHEAVAVDQAQSPEQTLPPHLVVHTARVLRVNGSGGKKPRVGQYEAAHGKCPEGM